MTRERHAYKAASIKKRFGLLRNRYLGACLGFFGSLRIVAAIAE